MRGFIVVALVLVLCFVGSIRADERPSNRKSRSSARQQDLTTVVHKGDVVIRAKSLDEAKEIAQQHNYTVESVIGHLKHNYYVLHKMNTVDDIEHYDEQELKKRGEEIHRALLKNVEWGEVQIHRKHDKRDDDPLFSQQWHIAPSNGRFRHVSANVGGAWDMGLSGRSVTVQVVDDGVQHTHPDLVTNYNSSISWDYNGNDHDPISEPEVGDRHGTSVAGLIAAGKNDGSCGSGIAYNAQYGGVRLISGPVSDAMEALALSHASESADIYSNSWGPTDDGKHLSRPGSLTTDTIQTMTDVGRDGKGTIYVWAAGNGRDHSDRADYDGYANMRETIAVAAVNADGKFAWYSEPGACVLISAPSSGTRRRGIVTTDIQGSMGYDNGDCTNIFGGTSAAAPIVSGVIALVLEANPELTWRDVQHILARSAARVDTNNHSWKKNGADLWVSDDYGYGLVDAKAAVELAKTWNSEDYEENSPYVGSLHTRAMDIPSDGTILTLEERVTRSKVGGKVEHARVMVNINHRSRGYLRIELISPSGTRSRFAELRNDRNDNYNYWEFTSVQFMGEDPVGTWKLEIFDRSRSSHGTLVSWKVELFTYGK
jgi:subtilisin family serine protease